MQLIRGIHNLEAMPSGAVVTMGNFDGVHLGHQKLLEEVCEKAQQYRLPVIVILFEPQPLEYFKGKNTITRLNSLREKLVALQAYHIDYVLCLKFNKQLANLSAENFVKNILVNKLAVRHVVIGYDFHFGAKRHGDVSLLEALGNAFRFDVTAVPAVTFQNERVSSTRLRQLLRQSDLEMVKQLRGVPYSLSGRVTHGDKRGRELGYPTANINLHRQIAPLSGIYLVRVKGLEKIYYGAASIGQRPMFETDQVLLEVYIFDFNREIYGQSLEIEFLRFLRQEQKFNSVAQLITQMRRDVRQARDYLLEYG